MSVALPVRSASFGRVNANAVLGQTLQVVVPVRLDDGERLTPECVYAEVYAGDTRLPSAQVRIQVFAGAGSGEWLAQISTTSPVEEPVLEVQVLAGCERRLSRRFTVLADPPLMASVAPAASVRPPAAPLPQADGAASASRGTGAAAATTTPSLSAGAAPRKPRNAASAAAAPSAALAPRGGPVEARPAAPASKSRSERGQNRLVLESGEGPLLRMDWEEPLLTGQAPGPDEAASAADQHLQALEGALNEFKQQGQAAQTRVLALEQQLAENSQASRLQPWLMGALALAVAAVGGLAWQVRRQARAVKQAQWWADEANKAPPPEARVEPAQTDLGHMDWSGSGSSGLLVASGMEPPEDWELPHPPAAPTPPSPSPALSPLATVAEPSGPVFNPLGTQPLEPISAPTREVSVEELLDLEQQADFFIALGQEDAAVDLLMAYLRSTGGQSPLPYTKLLEIYRRQGDRSAYERIRARFNRRFNAYAPDWDQGPQAGRLLEDYPEAIEQLQAVWRSPIDAMATLEAMLFRRDETQDMFDLPAYKDVLLVYSIARDLWSQGDVGSTEVDLLLPLGDVGASTFVAGEVLDLDAPASGEDASFTQFEMEHGLQHVAPPDSGAKRDPNH